MLELRPYQKECVESILQNIQNPTKDIVVLPTGAGKSIVIADTAHKVHGKVLVVSPSREITQQNRDKMVKYVDESEIGIYSASFNKKQVRTYTFATIQSIWKHPELFQDFSFVFIDECHRCEDTNLSSMFGSFFKDISPKVVGFTATPYRMYRYKPRFDGDFIHNEEEVRLLTAPCYSWDRIIFSREYKDLLQEGYLAPLKYFETNRIFVNDLVKKYAHIPKLLFADSVKHAKKLHSQYPEAEYIDAKTKKADRARIIEDFVSGKVTTLINYNALTTGFDAPNIQIIILYRDFSSPAEYFQAIGRGTRKSEGKNQCIIVDTKHNIGTHGTMTETNLHNQVGFLPGEEDVWHLIKGGVRVNGVKKRSTIRNPKSYR